MSRAGVRRIWMRRGVGSGAASPGALVLCRDAGVEPVTGLCAFMALPGAAWCHRVHAWIRGDAPA